MAIAIDLIRRKVKRSVPHDALAPDALLSLRGTVVHDRRYRQRAAPLPLDRNVLQFQTLLAEELPR